MWNLFDCLKQKQRTTYSSTQLAAINKSLCSLKKILTSCCLPKEDVLRFSVKNMERKHKIKKRDLVKYRNTTHGIVLFFQNIFVNNMFLHFSYRLCKTYKNLNLLQMCVNKIEC